MASSRHEIHTTDVRDTEPTRKMEGGHSRRPKLARMGSSFRSRSRLAEGTASRSHPLQKCVANKNERSQRRYQGERRTSRVSGSATKSGWGITRYWSFLHRRRSSGGNG